MRVSSIVPAAPEAVWARVTTPAGINDELRPWLQMTVPAALRGKTIDDLEAGQALGRSRLLLFGIVPVDYDDLFLAEVEPGRRFLERSEMLSMRLWEHERVVSGAVAGAGAGQAGPAADRAAATDPTAGEGATAGADAPAASTEPAATALITDRLAFELRPPLAAVPGAASLAAAIVRGLFRHRHARLAAHFGA